MSPVALHLFQTGTAGILFPLPSSPPGCPQKKCCTEPSEGTPEALARLERFHLSLAVLPCPAVDLIRMELSQGTNNSHITFPATRPLTTGATTVSFFHPLLPENQFLLIALSPSIHQSRHMPKGRGLHRHLAAGHAMLGLALQRGLSCPLGTSSGSNTTAKCFSGLFLGKSNYIKELKLGLFLAFSC